jgi:hypothetical protein
MNKKELESLICELFEIPNTNQMIDSQISKFMKERGYSYKEIGRALYFYVEVLGNTPKKEMGIGIVPHVMEEAKKHFYKLEIEQKKRKEQGNILKEDREVKEILVRPERKPRGIHKIKIEDL